MVKSTMQHVRDLKSLRIENSALAIGSFDGVHLGHQALVQAMVEDARQEGLRPIVLTFYPHPSVVLRGRRPAFYINSPDEKAALLGQMGVETVITQEFDEKLSQIRADVYLDLLIAHLGVRRLWIGENFALGYEREGNREFLERVSKVRSYSLRVVPPVSRGGEIISSTLVRQALKAGDVARVAEYLGRPFSLPGKVEAGVRRGKELGFPTANLSIWEERAYPRIGVYACWAEMRSQRWKAVTNIGMRPTFEDTKAVPIVETHLLQFNGNLYKKELKLTFIERLRDEERFPDRESLIEQIGRDVLRAEEILQEAVGVRDV